MVHLQEDHIHTLPLSLFLISSFEVGNGRADNDSSPCVYLCKVDPLPHSLPPTGDMRNKNNFSNYFSGPMGGLAGNCLHLVAGMG